MKVQFRSLCSKNFANFYCVAKGRGVGKVEVLVRVEMLVRVEVLLRVEVWVCGWSGYPGG